MQDRMDLQDALRACNWTVADAMAKIRGEIQTTEVVKAKKKSSGPKKKALKAHDAFELSGSESDEEGEYTDNRVVYNSSDDSDADSDFELLERAGKDHQSDYVKFSKLMKNPKANPTHFFRARRRR